jgi:hypothetical protein
MTPLSATIALLMATLLLGEVFLWRMFRRRIDPMTFPSERDASQFGVFRPNRMRAFAVVHTLLLGCWLLGSVLLLW